jgi:hypothetical protein
MSPLEKIEKAIIDNDIYAVAIAYKELTGKEISPGGSKIVLGTEKDLDNVAVEVVEDEGVVAPVKKKKKVGRPKKSSVVTSTPTKKPNFKAASLQEVVGEDEEDDVIDEATNYSGQKKQTRRVPFLVQPWQNTFKDNKRLFEADTIGFDRKAIKNLEHATGRSAPQMVIARCGGPCRKKYRVDAALVLKEDGENKFICDNCVPRGPSK